MFMNSMHRGHTNQKPTAAQLKLLLKLKEQQMQAQESVVGCQSQLSSSDLDNIAKGPIGLGIGSLHLLPLLAQAKRQ